MYVLATQKQFVQKLDRQKGCLYEKEEKHYTLIPLSVSKTPTYHGRSLPIRARKNSPHEILPLYNLKIIMQKLKHAINKNIYKSLRFFSSSGDQRVQGK